MTEKPTYQELMKKVEALEQAELKRLKAESELAYVNKRSRALLENSPICTKILDLDFNLQYMSSAGAKALKVKDVTELYGKAYPFDFYPDAFKSAMDSTLNQVVSEHKVVTQEAAVVDIEGNELWFHSTVVPVFDEEAKLEYLIVVSLDTTARKAAEHKLEEHSQNLEVLVKQRTEALNREIKERKSIEKKIIHLATHDNLTDLPNRSLLKDRLKHACARARREQTKVAVLFVDLDGFKAINDTLGHTIGDGILKELANRMNSCLRETDTVARFGGDEFVVIMTEVKYDKDVKAMAKNLCRTIRRAITFENKKIELGASIGIALYPDDGESPEQLISVADDAMYRVKNENKNGYAFSLRHSL